MKNISLTYKIKDNKIINKCYQNYIGENILLHIQNLM